MKKFYVTIQDSIGYDIEAETENEAIDIALEWWAERQPNIYVENEEESEE